MLQEEYREFLELPTGDFEACCKECRQTDSLSLIRLEHNRYSVPDIYASYTGMFPLCILLAAAGLWKIRRGVIRDNASRRCRVG